MKKLSKDFVKCGVIGWCMEIAVTSLQAFRRRGADAYRPYLSLHVSHLRGRLSAAPAVHPDVRFSLGRARLVYMFCIFGGEYVSGRFLQKRGAVPMAL